MKKYIPVTYYGMFNHTTDALSVVKDFTQIYVEVENGFLTEEDIAKKPDATVLELDVMSSGYKRFKIRGVSGTMKGYGFIHCSDARFVRTYGDYPIALHDRKEN